MDLLLYEKNINGWLKTSGYADPMPNLSNLFYRIMIATILIVHVHFIVIYEPTNNSDYRWRYYFL